MPKMARWCFRHRTWVIAGWLLALVIVVALSTSIGSKYNSNLSLPNTDSQAAANLLTKNFPAASGEGDQVVIAAAASTLPSAAAVRRLVTVTLAGLRPPRRAPSCGGRRAATAAISSSAHERGPDTGAGGRVECRLDSHRLDGAQARLHIGR